MVPPRREELLRVLAENPEGANRARAGRLLNWAGDEADTIARVLPGLDDPHGVTRNDVTRFLLHHVDRLEDEATLRALVEGLGVTPIAFAGRRSSVKPPSPDDTWETQLGPYDTIQELPHHGPAADE